MVLVVDPGWGGAGGVWGVLGYDRSRFGGGWCSFEVVGGSDVVGGSLPDFRETRFDDETDAGEDNAADDADQEAVGVEDGVGAGCEYDYREDDFVSPFLFLTSLVCIVLVASSCFAFLLVQPFSFGFRRSSSVRSSFSLGFRSCPVYFISVLHPVSACSHMASMS